MKKVPNKLILILLMIVFIFALIRWCTSGAPSKNDVSTKLQKYMEASTSSGSFSGSVLVADNSKIVFEKSYGMADYEKKISNRSDTKFRIGELTNQFTAMSIMILQEKGLLDVNDKVSKYIPDFSNGDKISIHDLLTMSSGITNKVNGILPDYNFTIQTTGMYDYTGNLTRKDEHFTPIQLIELFKDKPLDFKPGEKFKNSELNYIVLGYIIEKVSNMSYEQFIKNNIFTPLNMKNSGYDTNEVLPNQAVGYDKISPNTVKTISYDPSIAYSWGGLYSTIEDLYKWDQALYTEKLVKKETMAKIFKPYKEITGVQGFSYCSYGYGWIVHDFAKKPIVEDNSTLPGFISYIYRDESSKKTIIVLCNDLSYYPKFSEFCQGLSGVLNSPFTKK